MLRTYRRVHLSRQEILRPIRNSTMSFPTPTVEIQTPRLILRTPVLEDAPSYLSVFTNPTNYEYEPHKPINPTVERYERILTSFAAGTKTGENAFLSVCLKGDDGDVVIGNGGFNSIFERGEGEGKVRVGDAGIMIDSAHWRKGYAKEAVAAMLNWAFHLGEDEVDPKIDVVVFESLAANDRIRGLLSGCFGFKETMSSGDFGEERVWEIAKSDWEKRRSEMVFE
ncbi:acyl-CoA N-acyltransferase [Heliocybe sulcata]|uniref:Acyl-CoA N-acyltransferase n=1 Tax=Heliocybe sulcata TaxID=5364 RepID=A0A5C3MQI1_9AGAM|nr:acyl-CoA N-acyltransferase [Heliocybe sulcata]